CNVMGAPNQSPFDPPPEGDSAAPSFRLDPTDGFRRNLLERLPIFRQCVVEATLEATPIGLIPQSLFLWPVVALQMRVLDRVAVLRPVVHLFLRGRISLAFHRYRSNESSRQRRRRTMPHLATRIIHPGRCIGRHKPSVAQRQNDPPRMGMSRES